MINLVEFRNSRYWKRNLGGLFIVDERQLTDEEARKVVNHAIEHGYEYSSDIPDSEVASVLGWT